jgi:ribosomal protein S18 acetylase RimI-like enzyme
MTETRATLRAERPEDQDLAAEIYASTRAEEIALATDWTAEQRVAFLRFQADAQWNHYAAYYPKAQRWIVEVDGAPAGRLYLDTREDEIRVVDIALLPQFRGSGMGTALLEVVLQRAAAAGLAVRIHVEKMNPAMSLYRRLGFVVVEDKGVYDFMEWRAKR